MALTPGYYRLTLRSHLYDTPGGLVQLRTKDPNDDWWLGDLWFPWQPSPDASAWPPGMLEEAQAEGRLLPLAADDYFLAVLAGDWRLAWREEGAP